MKLVAIIPAYNEAATVGEVVYIAQSHQSVSRVLVVDDGSTDGTAQTARNAGAEVLRHKNNRGKAEAMETGVAATSKATHFLFLDADLVGFRSEHIDGLLEACEILRQAQDDSGLTRDDGMAMVVGLRDRGRILNWLCLHIFPWISGERIVPRSLWEAVPKKFKHRFQIELALNAFTRRQGMRILPVLLPGLSIRRKEQKIGWLPGFWARIKMTAELVATMVRLML